MIPVILSGGSGSRLWPLSRQHRPKQFLPIIDNEETLFQSTIFRLNGINDIQKPIVVCNENHRFMVAEQLQELSQAHQGIILEPVARNTAPAIALAALLSIAKDPDATLLTLPADHVIHDTNTLHKVISQARFAAEQGYLVTFGIVPHYPETGYGYIKYSNTINLFKDASCNEKNNLVRRVDAFFEKPDQKTADEYINSNNFLWNSGMFLFRADSYLTELKKYQPDILNACKLALKHSHTDLDFIRADKKYFSQSSSLSIDYAVMEHTEKAAVIPLDAGWSDVGSWSAVWNEGQQDEQGNVVRGDTLLQNTQNSLVYSENHLITLLGVKDLIVVETKDATLVAHKDHAQDIKLLVEQLKNEKRPETMAHRKVYRPWGSFESIDLGNNFQVKRIIIKPGGAISLQKHHHRAEHWIVVNGTAEVTRGKDVFLVTKNESTYIPLGVTHRLTNPGKIPLEIIEIQSGCYLGEDDIVRFEDQYGRATTSSDI